MIERDLLRHRQKCYKDEAGRGREGGEENVQSFSNLFISWEVKKSQPDQFIFIYVRYTC